MIEDRSPLKHSVHKVCVPNLHIAHFRKAQDDEILQFVGFSVWHPTCGSVFRQFHNLFDGKNITEQPSRRS